MLSRRSRATQLQVAAWARLFKTAGADKQTAMPYIYRTDAKATVSRRNRFVWPGGFKDSVDRLHATGQTYGLWPDFR